MRSCWSAFALLALGCAANEPTVTHAEPAPEPVAAPTSGAPEIDEPDASPVVSVDAATPTASVSEGPKSDNPGWTDVQNATHEKMLDGFYFVDGSVVEVPCKACERPPACKPGGDCPKAKDCSFCEPVVRIEDGGNSAGFEFEDRLTAPAFQKKQRVRIVFEKRGALRLFVRQSKPCPPSECLETDPPMKLDSAAKGKAVRRDDARCYAKQECAPNAKCNPDADTRVRCP